MQVNDCTTHCLSKLTNFNNPAVMAHLTYLYSKICCFVMSFPINDDVIAILNCNLGYIKIK